MRNESEKTSKGKKIIKALALTGLGLGVIVGGAMVVVTKKLYDAVDEVTFGNYEN